MTVDDLLGGAFMDSDDESAEDEEEDDGDVRLPLFINVLC
jgi:hypothetical protein